ncbi:MAG TPA: DUF6582 domain-containing protein [Candidatus Eremiobacteraceae bacterium]|nr:DUF6582 domain-containing protein [Candidatus Eremiobacteraceae bacterium]
MQIEPTWRPFTGPADTPRSQLPDSAFAFPAERSEPLTDAAHVRSAIARFGQVHGVTEAERDVAFKNIEKAAAYYDVVVHEKDRHDI